MSANERWNEMAKHPGMAEIALFVKGRAHYLGAHVRDCDTCIAAVGRWIMLALAIEQDRQDQIKRRRA